VQSIRQSARNAGLLFLVEGSYDADHTDACKGRSASKDVKNGGCQRPDVSCSSEGASLGANGLWGPVHRFTPSEW